MDAVKSSDWVDRLIVSMLVGLVVGLIVLCVLVTLVYWGGPA